MSRNIISLFLAIIIHIIIIFGIYYLITKEELVDSPTLPKTHIKLNIKNQKDLKQEIENSSKEESFVKDEAVSADKIVKDQDVIWEKWKREYKSKNKKEEAKVQEANNRLDNELINIYGDSYNRLTEEEKIFLDKNYNKIVRMIHNNIYYPDISIRLKHEGVVYVNFEYDSRKIKYIRIEKGSGYKELDISAKEAIKYTLKDFPKVNKPIKIKLKINFNIR